MTRYVLFRGGPVFLAASFVGVTAERWGESAAAGVTVLLAVHVANTYGLVLFRAVRARRLEQRIVFFWLASVVLVVVSGLLSVPLTKSIAPLVPPPAEMSAALWTGAFATAVAIASIRSLSGDANQLDELLGRSATRDP
jgi:hypothetical protein